MSSKRAANHARWQPELKEFFHGLVGETPVCENCGSTQPPIDMAHSKKRVEIRTREEFFDAVLLCRKCHDSIELGKKRKEMYDAVQYIKKNSRFRDEEEGNQAT